MTLHSLQSYSRTLIWNQPYDEWSLRAWDRHKREVMTDDNGEWCTSDRRPLSIKAQASFAYHLQEKKKQNQLILLYPRKKKWDFNIDFISELRLRAVAEGATSQRHRFPDVGCRRSLHSSAHVLRIFEWLWSPPFKSYWWMMIDDWCCSTPLNMHPRAHHQSQLSGVSF